MLITHVLVTTAAAPPEIGAMRGYALGRRFRHLDEFSLGEGFFFPDHARRNLLALDCERDEDCFALHASNAFAAKGDVINDQLKVVGHATKVRRRRCFFHRLAEPLSQISWSKVRGRSLNLCKSFEDSITASGLF